ncbi:AI-2E family transporter [Oscillatoria amoena NRMC-F 0135]|nr:AI-2E family transporter [Oscillatoria amoena NRMC-F 0135]
MNNSSNSPISTDRLPNNPVIHYALQLLALALLLIWCFRILESFITPLVWGAILAITLYPLHKKITQWLKGRKGWSAVIITVLLIGVILGPAVGLLLSTVDEVKELATAYREGELHVPPPSAKVKEWPVIGSTLYGYWSKASTNLTALITENRDQVKAVLLNVVDMLASTAKGIVLFALSILISGGLLAYAKPSGDFARNLFVKLAGKAGESMAASAELTVRNVAKGILGVAVIQSLLAGIGFVLAGVPLAGVWILICLVLAIVQVGLLPVSVGVIIYIWSAADAVTATVLTIWMIFVGVVDNILKPIMLGKGAPAPMLVVFLGAIGGFIAMGFIGLFTGAIILTLAYNLITDWLNGNPPEPTENSKG